MHQYIYVSKARENLSTEDINALLETSRLNNKSRDITGVLVYNKGCFIQVLEGPQKQLDALLDIIKQDPRNSNVMILSSIPITERMFEQWDMAYLDQLKDRILTPLEEGAIVPLKEIDENLESAHRWVTGFLEEAVSALH